MASTFRGKDVRVVRRDAEGDREGEGDRDPKELADVPAGPVPPVAEASLDLKYFTLYIGILPSVFDEGGQHIHHIS